MTRRRWIAESWDEATATIAGVQAEHLARVLRAQPGMQAEVVAGGHVFHAQVVNVTLAGENSEVRFNLAAELLADPALPITLVMAVYKFDRMEWAIEKATELGVAAIAPWLSHSGQKSIWPRLQPSAPNDGVVLRTRHRNKRAAPMCLDPYPVSLAGTCARSLHPPASCLQSRSAPPPCVTHWRRPSQPPRRGARA